VYVGFVGSAAQRTNAPARLEEHAHAIKLQLGSVLRLKFTPQIKFAFDDSVERGTRVLHILDELDAPKEGPAR